MIMSGHLKLPLVSCGQSLPAKCEKWCIRSRSGLARKHVLILCCYRLHLIVGKVLLTDIEWTFLSLQEYFTLYHGFVQFYHNRRLIALLTTLYLSYNCYWYWAILSHVFDQVHKNCSTQQPVEIGLNGQKLSVTGTVTLSFSAKTLHWWWVKNGQKALFFYHLVGPVLKYVLMTHFFNNLKAPSRLKHS